MNILVVNAFIRKKNKFLVVRRKSLFFGGMLAFPGGKVEENESPTEALQREVYEETGFKIELISSTPVLIGDILVDSHRATIEVYKAKLIGGKRIKQEEEIEEIVWVKPDEFLNSLKEKSYPKNHVERIKEFLLKEKLLLG